VNVMLSPAQSFLYVYVITSIWLLLVETKAQAAVTDTVKHRLEQLDDFEEVWFICGSHDEIT